MQRQVLTLTVLLAGVGLVACGSDSGGTGGSTTTATTTTTTGTTSTTSTTSTSSTGTGGAAPTSQCVEISDLGIIQDPVVDVSGKAAQCGADNLAMSPATKDCIVTATGLSDSCAACFESAVVCAASQCGTQCVPQLGGDPAGQACTDCRKAACDPAFYTCTGLPPN